MSSVNTNVAAMAAIRSLSQVAKDMGNTQGRIESGLRISQANHDPAVFAIAQNMRADLNGMMAVKDSLSFGKAATLDPTDPEVMAAMQTICKKTRAAGKIAGVHTDGAKTAIKRFADGYQYCTLLNDVRAAAIQAQSWINEVRGKAKADGPKSY